MSIVKVRGLGITMQAHAPADILFVDSTVRDARELLSGLAPGTQVVWLSGDRDPLDAIANHIDTLGPVRRLSILAHGHPGSVLLSGKTIDSAFLIRRRAALSRIRKALEKDGEILLVACSTGAGPKGVDFTRGLADELRVPVRAAAADIGGAAGWQGLPAAAALFSEAARAAYPHRLAVTGTPSAGNDNLTSDAAADLIDALAGNDTITGGDGADTLSGNAGADLIFGGDSGASDNAGNLIDGGAGSDTITGGSLDDTISGGDDGDSIQGQAGNDIVYGGNGDDSVNGGSGTDLLYGGSGNDAIAGSGDNDTLYGDAGDDSLTGDAGNDIIIGGSGNDLLIASSGTNSLDGGDGNDTLSAGSGADTLSGGSGNDVFRGSTTQLNADTVTGLTAGDTILVTGHDGSGLNGSTLGSTISLGGSTLNVAGAASNLTINASYDGSDTTLTFSAAASSSGSGGSSLTVSSGGIDDLAGTAVNRTLTNNSGASATGALVENTGSGSTIFVTLPSAGAVVNSGTAAAQTGDTASLSLHSHIQASNTDAAEKSFFTGHADSFMAWKGSVPMDIRTLTLSTTGSGQTVDLFDAASGSTGTHALVIDTTGLAGGNRLALDNIDFAAIVGNASVSGGAGQNFVIGDDAAQFISLGAEDDTLAGGGGNDTVGSSWGEDLIYGNQGQDSLFGGGGTDTLFGGQDADTLAGDNDGDILYGNKGNDILLGGENDDRLYGGQNEDLVYGNSGNDRLDGNLGNDTLYGGQGNDSLNGGDGDDRLEGNTGDDTLSGGAGADTFVFSFGTGHDRVADYVSGTDSLAFESGLTYAAADSNGNTILSLSDGGSVTLVGVPASEFIALQGWDLAN